MNLEAYRDEFEATKNGQIYLNHAGVSPLPRRCAEAMREAIVWNSDLTPENWDRYIGGVERCRKALGAMLNVSPEDIALSRNTTEGINWIAGGMDWKPGDRVVTVEGEYPANIYPWMRLQKKGVELVRIQPVGERVPLERIEKELTPQTRLVSLSYVEFASGFRFDVEAVGDLCQKKGIPLLVDLIQGMGVFPIDLVKWKVTFAAGGGQKWLLGPQGGGFFYCPDKHLDLVETTTVGATSIVNWTPYTDYDFTLRPNASRYEYGTPSTLPLIGMAASVEMLNEAGMENVCERVRIITDVLIDGAGRKGYICHSPRGESEWSGIVIISHPNHSPNSVVENLQVHDIQASEREGRIRLAPHFYQTEEEMIRVIDRLP
ncbi:MAG: aminotransferase class V-fold PLP-dependent enzyme [Candidatus Omnitrophica bacterium]|nr:aminotransferase class V-fold PLP-dependent enzyme [Candidatus Omnitrophota bacterium]